MKKNKSKVKPVHLVIMMALILAVIWFVIGLGVRQEQNSGLETSGGQVTDVTGDEDMTANFNLENGLEITEIGTYSGTFMEDGSDEEVQDVLMIKVTNTSDTVLQYTEIVLKEESGEEARFALSTLPPNETVVVLEATRKEFKESVNYVSAEAQDVVFFNEGISMHSDKLELGGLEGAFNIKNISEEDITGDVYIYYKNYEEDLFYGGITYRAKVEGGIKAGEIKQVMTKHYDPETCMVMFVTIGE